MGTRVALVLLGLWCSIATAQEPVDPDRAVRVAVVDGVVRPGATAVIEVSAVEGDGSPVLTPPRVSSSVGPVRLLGSRGAGTWSYGVQVPATASDFEVNVGAVGRRWTTRMGVWEPDESTLALPNRMDGVAGSGEVVFQVTGERLPPPEHLQVHLGEGRVVDVTQLDDTIQVTIQPEDLPYPRTIPVGVRDRRSDERPAWGGIRMRAGRVLDLDVEPGAQVTFSLGTREYGPFTADEEGRIVARVDQYPGEDLARAVFVDDLGNELVSEIPLATPDEPDIVLFPDSEIVPGQLPPVLYVAAFNGAGFPWRGDAPTCRTPATDLTLRQLNRGVWMVPLPRANAEPEDVRVDCRLGAKEAHAQARVQVTRGIPANLRLRVWPLELRTDFPFAELRLVLEDHRGERLAPDGIRVWADGGTVDVGEPTAYELVGDYDGTLAVDRQVDVVRATWDATTGDALARSVEFGWEDIALGGRVPLMARVLDHRLRPVPDFDVRMSAGGRSEISRTDETGVARAMVVLPEGSGPVQLSATAGTRTARALVVRGTPGRPLSSHRLQADANITLTPGRVTGLSVEVDPAVLRAAPGATAYVLVNVEDRAGAPITDEDVVLEVSEGELGPLRVRGDGTLLAEYIPATSERPREVEITARVESLSSSARLMVAPRPVRMTLGAWAGIATNFGKVTSGVVSLDGDLRIRNRIVGESLMVRLGVSRYAFRDETNTGIGPVASVRVAAYPLRLAALFRRDQGRFGAWVGGGMAVTPHEVRLAFGEDEVGRGFRVTAGPLATAGVGWRLLGGEVLATTTALWVPVAGGEAGFTGNIGGVAIGGGYRLVF